MRLLEPIFHAHDAKRETLLEEFIGNGRRFDESMLFRLISAELSLREELGERLVLEYTKKRLSKEQLEKAEPTVGLGIIWDMEASLSVRKITGYDVREEGGSYSVSVRCEMVRTSGHETRQAFPAEMTVAIGSGLEVGDIHYNGRLMPGTGWMRKLDETQDRETAEE